MVNFNRQRLKHPLSLIVIFSLILLLSPFFRNAFLAVLRQPLIIFNWIGDEIQAMVFFHRNHYENKSLKDEVDVLRTRLARMEELARENERLRELLNFKETSDYPLVAARVIARSAQSWSSIFLIDKGADDGIKKGMGVITRGGFVGRIIQVQSDISRVLLISDPNLGVSAMSQRSRQEGLISGTLGKMLIMRYLPDEPDIVPGDIIVTSGLAETYPKGLIIGTVIEVNRDISGLSYHALVQPHADLGTIEEVLVIIS